MESKKRYIARGLPIKIPNEGFGDCFYRPQYIKMENQEGGSLVSTFGAVGGRRKEKERNTRKGRYATIVVCYNHRGSGSVTSSPR